MSSVQNCFCLSFQVEIIQKPQKTLPQKEIQEDLKSPNLFLFLSIPSIYSVTVCDHSVANATMPSQMVFIIINKVNHI